MQDNVRIRELSPGEFAKAFKQYNISRRRLSPLRMVLLGTVIPLSIIAYWYFTKVWILLLPGFLWGVLTHHVGHRDGYLDGYEAGYRGGQLAALSIAPDDPKSLLSVE